MKRTAIILAVALSSGMSFADEHADIEAGAKLFKKCQACHVIRNDEGEALAGKGKTGPNLYGVVGRQAGSLEGFRYKKSIVAAGEAGLIWDETEMASYLMDPTKYLRAYLDDGKARTSMTLKLRKEEDAVNVSAFVASFSPQTEEETDDDKDDN